MNRPLVVPLLALAAGALACAPAFATLGGAPAVPATAAAASAAQPARSAYTLPSGTAVTEYLNPQGLVFAVTWSGPTLPDMQALLGANFARFEAAQRQPARGPHAPVRLGASDLQVVSGGHAGALRGAAWLPALVPAGFDTGALL